MTWAEPDRGQFEKAENHGIEYALGEIASNVPMSEQPLDGEHAGALTPRKVAGNVGFYENLSAHGQTYLDGVDELAKAWLTGYFDTWRSHEYARRV